MFNFAHAMALQTKPRTGAGRIFENPVLEALTKTHIAIPLALFWSAGALTLWYSMARLGIPLKAGEVILSGSLAALIPVQAGDVLRMSLGGIGSCGVRFG